MIKLDDNLLQELGLGVLSPEEKKKMLAHIYETLEMRVGMELAKQMSDAQLNEFEEFINRNDEAGALQWLESNFPNYKDVVAAEFEKLKLEVRQVAPQIVASNQQQQQMAASQSQPGYPPVQQPPQGYPPAPAPGQQQYVPQQPLQPGQQPYYPPAPTPGSQQQQPYPYPQQAPPPAQPGTQQQPGQSNDYDLAA